MEENKKSTTLAQREYQKRYDKKTKMISIKYVLSDMDDYDRLMEYLERTGKSANGFIKELINDFFEQKKYVMDDSRIAEYFTDYEVSGELLDKLKTTVGSVKYDLIMDCCKDDIESDIYMAFGDRGGTFDEWIEQFLEDIESGDIDISISEKEFRKLVNESMSGVVGNIYCG